MSQFSKLLIATKNPGKLKEVKALLSDLDFEMLGLSDVFQTQAPEVKETGTTYEANAKLKAQTIGKLVQLPTLADDSGLEVTSLNNFPGIKSARWHPGSDTDRNQALLKKMQDINDRRARYVAVICLYLPRKDQFICSQGVLEGKIAQKPTTVVRGGFGYDSIFIPSGYNRPLAELGDDVKIKISHRTKAIETLKTKLNHHVPSTIIYPTKRNFK
jgi:XTP/dITP diphosphohydrolase